MLTAPCKRWRAFPFPCIAGRATTSAGLKISAATLGGGLVATGNYPGKARTPEELRADLEKAFSLIPGKHRFNLHAVLRRIRRQESGPQRNHAGPFPELD